VGGRFDMMGWGVDRGTLRRHCSLYSSVGHVRTACTPNGHSLRKQGDDVLWEFQTNLTVNYPVSH
jgi:hypothetical protein